MIRRLQCSRSEFAPRGPRIDCMRMKATTSTGNPVRAPFPVTVINLGLIPVHARAYRNLTSSAVTRQRMGNMY